MNISIKSYLIILLLSKGGTKLEFQIYHLFLQIIGFFLVVDTRNKVQITISVYVFREDGDPLSFASSMRSDECERSSRSILELLGPRCVSDAFPARVAPGFM